MNTRPAPLVRASYTRGQWSLVALCPYCGHRHQHGGGTELDEDLIGQTVDRLEAS